MDLFLVNKNQQSLPISPIAIGIAGAALIGFYYLSKALSFDQQDEERSQLGDKSGDKPAGIYNQGNTCFVNSLLQALSSLQSFQKLLKDTAANFRGNLNPHEQLIIELGSVLSQINNASQSISVSSLLSTIDDIKQGLINLQQQDAHQLYTAIISCMDETLNNQKRLDLSASIKEQQEIQQFQNPLIGYMKSSTICTSCKSQTSIKIDPFYDLSLDISKLYVYDVKSALLEFQRQQKIDHWICSNCSIIAHCKKLNDAITKLQGVNKQKLIFIAQAIIDFLENQISDQDEIKDVNFKLQNFGRTFMEQYQKMIGDPQRQLIFVELEGKQSSIHKKTVITKYPKILVIHLKQLVINPFSGQPVLLKKHITFDQTLSIETKNKEKNYQLTGLLTHIGTESFGHYLSFRRMNRESNQWFVMNDSMSQKIIWQKVKQCKAYMLFYDSL